MNKSDLIRSLEVRIEHNQKEFGICERLHGEEVAASSSPSFHSAHSEMRDWHAGKIEAYKQALKMIQELDA